MNQHLSSRAADDQFNSISRKLTWNITLKDLNLEAARIASSALRRRNVRTNREEKEVYLSGPYFPGEECKLKNKTEKKTKITPNEIFTENGQNSNVEKSSEILIRQDKPNSSEEGKAREISVSESCKSFTSSKTKVPILSTTDLTDEKSSNSSTERQMKITEDCIKQGTSNREDIKVATVDSGGSSKHVDLDEITATTENSVEIAKDKQSANIKAGGTLDTRRSSSHLECRPTTPLFERRRSSRLSHVSNESKTSPNQRKNSRISASADPFSLENILNPLLRESLKKILNPQCHVQSEDNEENATPIVARDRENNLKEEILLPTIERRFVKHRSLEFDEQVTSAWSGKYRKRSTKLVRFGRQSPELSSTQCAGIVVSSNRPVRMLSAGSHYAVKGVIGQWLKERSTYTAQGERGKDRAEKQETFREVQLLKVGLSMRMLAGIV